MITLSMQTSIYVCGYYFREEGFTASFISIMVSVGLFLLLETLYWYRWYQTKPPFHKVLTLLLHIHAIANVLGIAFTFKHTVVHSSKLSSNLHNITSSSNSACSSTMDSLSSSSSAFTTTRHPRTCLISWNYVNIYGFSLPSGRYNVVSLPLSSSGGTFGLPDVLCRLLFRILHYELLGNPIFIGEALRVERSRLI